ncbi:MAG: hypothetical protein AB7S26_01975 [Sandaracinaceae bacterium]
MKKIVLALLLCLCPVLASAQAPEDPSRLFSNRATLELPYTAGLTRLPLDARVLDAARPDFSDVRLYDSQGREVPYVVDAGEASDETQHLSVTITEVERHIDGDLMNPRSVERYVLALPSYSGAARLVLGTEHPSFVARVRIRELGDPPGPTVERSIYRMQDPLRERLGFDLEPMTSATPLVEVEITSDGGVLQPTFDLVVTRDARETSTLTIPLTELSRAREDGVTRVAFTRPVGFVPSQITLSTSTASFARNVRVYDVVQGEPPRMIGSGLVYGVREIPDARELSIPVSRARGAVLRVEVDDGDSPELARLTAAGVAPRPGLVFDQADPSIALYFGGARTRAPVYDLAFLGAAWLDRRGAQPLPASIVSVGTNPGWADGPALEFAMHPGRPVNVGDYAYTAELPVRGAREGLSVVALHRSVVAEARVDLADLRVVDRDDRQWPYLITSRRVDRVATTIASPRVDGERSRYAIALPVSRAVVRAVRLSTDATFVSRRYSLRGLTDAEGWTELASGFLERDPRVLEAIELVIGPATRVTALELAVDDGGDAPMAWSAVELDLDAPVLYLAAPDGDYRVLVGDAEASPASYEIERARELVLSANAAEALSGEASVNPSYAPPAWWSRGGGWSWLVWIVLALAIAVLGLLTWRAARTSDGGDPPPPPPEGPAPGEDGSPPDPEGAPPGPTVASRPRTF